MSEKKMYPIILVGIGGFVGAILRYLVSGFVQQNFTNFPVGTFVVNFIGSFILGFIMFGSQHWGWFEDNTRIFLTIGLLGSFTTMSTFNYETFRMIESQRYAFAVLNFLLNVILGIIAIFFGKIVTLSIWK